MTSHGLLFIGNGGAAISAVRAARAAGYEGPVQMVSDTAGETFNPMLSPYFLAGQIPFESCFPFGRDFYSRYKVRCRFDLPVVSLDPFSREIRLADGTVLAYDRCLVATGARPVFPRVPGIDGSRYVYTLRTAEDTIRLNDAIARTSDALILGASLIGLKMAEIILSKGARVTLVDIADQVLPGAAHPECASIVEEVVREKGVDLRLKTSLQGVEDGRKKAAFHFQDGEILEAELCLLSIGIEPRLDFIDGSQVKIDRGINLLTGRKEVIGLWGNACYQGRTAGSNMGGRKATYRGAVPDHVSTVFGVRFAHLGDVHSTGEEVLVIADQGLSEEGYRLLSFEKGVLKGVNLLNDLRHAGKLKSAIRRRLDWTGELERLRPFPAPSVLEMILGKWIQT
ncbi:MAG: NAD(P)/FAD-dependent oxidoreductase [Deltaproteobacteria bacterium]|nr:NAD(P)/FAD-dependent oxidoreductase [Deltaproteobacteria bacterium]